MTTINHLASCFYEVRLCEGEAQRHEALPILSPQFKSSELFETVPIEVSGKTFLSSVQDYA